MMVQCEVGPSARQPESPWPLSPFGALTHLVQQRGRPWTGRRRSARRLYRLQRYFAIESVESARCLVPLEGRSTAQEGEFELAVEAARERAVRMVVVGE